MLKVSFPAAIVFAIAGTNWSGDGGRLACAQSDSVEILSGERVWADRDNRISKSATFVRQDSEAVLLRSAIGEEFKIAKDVLNDSDQRILGEVWYGDQDRQQFSLVQTFHKSLADGTNAALVEQIKTLHSQFPESPYAGLLGSVATIIAGNNFEEASRLLADSKKRIEKQRKLLGGETHIFTEKSIGINAGLCLIKSGKSNSILGHWGPYLSGDPDAVLIHNCRLLVDNQDFFRLTNRTEKTLKDALARWDGVGATAKSGGSFQFSLGMNSPQVVNSQGPTNLYSLNPWSDIWCLSCYGRGVRSCPFKACKNGKIILMKEVVKFVNPSTGSPVYATIPDPQPCSNCNGSGSVRCELCNGSGRLDRIR